MANEMRHGPDPGGRRGERTRVRAWRNPRERRSEPPDARRRRARRARPRTRRRSPPPRHHCDPRPDQARRAARDGAS
eukprot:2734559-Alexandrium_andersonii.AAC.1